VTLYATTTATSNNALVRVIDTGAGSVATVIASAGANYVFRGAAMAPGATPTPVTLTALAAEPAAAGGALLRWATATEYDVAGYHIRRSSDGRREHAERVTAELIPASGDGLAGGDYRWHDLAGAEGADYWLEVIDRDGTSLEYGPVRLTPASAATSKHTVFLPAVASAAPACGAVAPC
jgi:hypothetical protein